MFKCIVLFLSTGMVAALAQAQPDTGEPAKAVEAVHVEGAANAQPQRATLRQVLQSQRDGRAQPGAATGAVRQLNPQERAQLREQLRQQRPSGVRLPP